ncbi:MAG: carbohydrate-binding protein [Haliscomenobacter sp.]|nr:carbohydrate-binding protein [Haliscomenobacter sp.]
MKRIPAAALFCFFFAMMFQAKGQEFLKAHGKVIIKESGDTFLLRGMGLGGWMLQEGYMLQTAGFANPQYQIRAKIQELIGPEATDQFYDAWLSNHVRKIDIDSLGSWGFNAVRLPMHYNLFTLPIEKEPVPGQNTWLDKGFELTDSLISWCKQNGMYVILDLHATPGGQGKDQGISDYDPSKPSLWESKANQAKTIALWKRIAQKYANEPTVAGYDLINEPNWDLPSNVQLRNLYEALTDSIRAVDTKHILFIEGNWFANDFTRLLPPWDDNIVYSPHKYWSYNDQASIQWVLDIRQTFGVPIFLGESGENSNVWFRDAIKLLEDQGIGWAWWPMKKIESIAGPLSVVKTPAYQALLDYWNGTGPAPSAAFAKNALMGITEGLKLENCIYQKDVIDAMFRQVYSDETAPFKTQNIPGVVYSTDFDMGILGSAYFDTDVANYQVSSGIYTSWNNGWSYRNDAVDIEATKDSVHTNGYSVGWLGAGEWMQYDVQVAQSAAYDVDVRVAANGTDGKFHFSAGGSDISRVINVPNTGGWQTWQNLRVPNVVLTPGDKKLRFYVDGAGFNLGSFKFVEKASTNTVPAFFTSAITLNEKTVQLNLNKPMAAPLSAAPAGFQIFVNGGAIPITAVSLNSSNPRIVYFTVNYKLKATDVVKISYSGTQILAQDGTPLNLFSLETVKNNLIAIHSAPGKVEAEGFFFQSGTQLETTSDVGGGQNISYLDVGDYLDYYIDVAQAGTYPVHYRTAALQESGEVQMKIISPSGTASTLHTVRFPPTGGWQTWTTTSATAELPAGRQHIRIVITKPLFNMNWFEFTLLTSTDEANNPQALTVFPNPGTGLFTLKGALAQKQNIEVEVHSLFGQSLFVKKRNKVKDFNETLDLSTYPAGIYFVIVRTENEEVFTQKVVKQ